MPGEAHLLRPFRHAPERQIAWRNPLGNLYNVSVAGDVVGLVLVDLGGGPPIDHL